MFISVYWVGWLPFPNLEKWLYIGDVLWGPTENSLWSPELYALGVAPYGCVCPSAVVRPGTEATRWMRLTPAQVTARPCLYAVMWAHWRTGQAHSMVGCAARRGLGLLLASHEWGWVPCMVVCVAQGRVSWGLVLAHWWVGGSPTVMH